MGKKIEQTRPATIQQWITATERMVMGSRTLVEMVGQRVELLDKRILELEERIVELELNGQEET